MGINERSELAERMLSYCRKFNVPIEFLFEILEDQKVTPMIRGKATEYNAYLVLDKLLPHSSWNVQKLNLNPQSGTSDEDITITHRRSGIMMKVESKNAVRESISTGKKTTILKVPHFKVKCHRSRSNIKLAGTSNDRYSEDSFDVLITNPSNAIIQGNTIGEQLELVHDQELQTLLLEYYNVDNPTSLITSAENDWRYCLPSDISVDGFIPRTPYVKLRDDENWKSIQDIEGKLIEVVEKKRRSLQTARRS